MDKINAAWDWVFARPAEAWAATASWVTVLIGLATVVVAGLYAKKQVDEARKTREEQAQPNVAVFMESNPTKWMFVELAVRNFGLTPAYSITVSIAPSPDVSPRHGKPRSSLDFPSAIPSLMPGQEWRTGWDFGPNRLKDPDRLKTFEAVVKYEDSRGKVHETKSTLDWGLYEMSSRLEVKTAHDIHSVLKDHTEAIVKISEALAGAGSADHGFVVYDGGPFGPEIQRREAEEAERWRRLEELSQRDGHNEANPPSGDETAAHSTPEATTDQTEPPGAQGG